MGGAIQRAPLNIATVVTTLAGAAPGSDGIGLAARFDDPLGIVSDGANLYVADTYSNTIRKIVIATNAVTTLAGAAYVSGSNDGAGGLARFARPSGITIAGNNLYVVDDYDHTIRKIVIATGEVTTIAGTANALESINNIGAAARFGDPTGISTDGSNLYVADVINNNIRNIVIATGEVTTLAGTVNVRGSADGTGAAAQFMLPQAVTNLGLQGQLPPPAHGDGTGTAAQFTEPFGTTTDGTNLYVVDDDIIRKVVIATGAVTTLAGVAESEGTTDGIGDAARFDNPQGVTNDGIHLYVTDGNTHLIRKIVIATGEVTTLAGAPGENSGVDGIGVAARFDFPQGYYHRWHKSLCGG